MKRLLLLCLLACTSTDKDEEVEDSTPTPDYVCPGNPDTPCSLAPETCELAIDCTSACRSLVDTCAADACVGAGDPAAFLCTWTELLEQNCTASCGGTVAASNCSDRMEWHCAERYDTCEDINACWQAAVGQ